MRVSSSQVKGVGIAISALALIAVFARGSPTYGGMIGGALILIAAIIPIYLWNSAGANGIPLFPVFCFGLFITHGIPLLVGAGDVSLYSDGEQFEVGITVAGSIVIGTACWWFGRKLRVHRPEFVRALSDSGGEVLFLVAIGAGAIYWVSAAANWIDIPPELAGIVRAFISGLSTLGIFVLFYRMSLGTLSLATRTLLWIGLFGNVIAQAASLLLVGPIQIIAAAIAGYVIGRRRIPWIPIFACITVVGILHAGKGEMREEYWFGVTDPAIRPTAYPEVFADWFYRGAEILIRPTVQDEQQSLIERSSLVWQLLYVQRAVRNRLDYAEGVSYAPILQILVPRLLVPDKPTSHEGTILLNIHFDLQTRESAATTTIGWGLLNEAYANFGLAGSILLLSGMGIFLGYLQVVTETAPFSSIRVLWALLILTLLMQSEITMAVFLSALFQASVALISVSWIMSERVRISA